MSRKSFESKKSTVARLITLLLAASVLLSACWAEQSNTSSEGGVSSEANESQNNTNSEEFFESSCDTSLGESLEESEAFKEESSEQSEEASEHISETSDEEPAIERTKLTPVLELDIGLYAGDNELAAECGDYGYAQLSSEFFVRGNEILIYDYGNRRLLLYRDGALADKVNVEEELLKTQGVDSELLMLICAFDEKYYYIFQPHYPDHKLIVIDRTTKEYTYIKADFRESLCGYDEYSFVINNSEIYLLTAETYESCFRIDGKTITEADNPLGCTLDANGRKPYLVMGDEKIPLERSPGWKDLSYLECKINGDQYLISCPYYSDFLKPNGYGKLFETFYRYDSDGNLTGRYLWKKNFLAQTHGYTVGEDGELYVIMFDINMRDFSTGKLSINRVEFGMDEPFSEKKDYEPDVTVELPPPENPTKLTPIIELSAGDGDYEVGFCQNVYGEAQSAIECAVYKNEVLVFDYLNTRILIYSDGKLTDEIDTSDFIKLPYDIHYAMQDDHVYCRFDDKYYYILNEYDLLVIDRKTKAQTVLDLTEGKSDKPSYWVKLVQYGANVYLEKMTSARMDKYYKVESTYFVLSGTTLSESDAHQRFSIRQDGRRNYLLADGKEIELEYSPDWDLDCRLTPEGISGDGSYVLSSRIQSYLADVETTRKSHRVFYKYNAEGKIVGRYTWEMPYYNNIDSHGYAFDENGEFYIVLYTDVEISSDNSVSDATFGIYRIDFGMDHPFHSKEYLLK